MSQCIFLTLFRLYCWLWGDDTLSKWETTIHVSTLCPFCAHLVIAWSQMDLSCNSFSPLHAPSAVINTRASQSRILSANESAEKPANWKKNNDLVKWVQCIIVWNKLKFFNGLFSNTSVYQQFVIVLVVFTSITTFQKENKSKSS